MTSIPFGQTSSVIDVVYEDDESFWGIDSGGVGSIDISIGEETGTVYSGSSSLRYQVVSGSKAWVNIQHTYGTPQDWSGYDDLAFYWYGKGSGEVFRIYVEASSWGNQFSGSFEDDFTGWGRVVLPLSGFSSVGSPSWSGVKKFYLTYGGALNTWNLDKMTLEGNTPPVPSVYSLNINVNGLGSVVKNPDKLTYDEGEAVELTATPQSGWVFSGWSGDLTGSNTPETIIMDGDKSIIAAFTEEIDDTVRILYEDDESFWNTASGGVGSIDISIGEETGTVYSGSSSLRYQVISGSKAWVNIQHTYGTPQDWSGYDDLAFYWYGKNSGKQFSVIIEASAWVDRFAASFVDDFDGWQKISLPLAGFSKIGSPSWSNAKKIIMPYGGALNTWNLDKMTLEANSIITTSGIHESYNKNDLGYFSTATLDVIAARFSTITTWALNSNKAPIQYLKSVNPELIILMYHNVHTISSYNEEAITLARENGWILLDAEGNEIYEQKWPQMKVIDPGNAGFRNWLAIGIAEKLTLFGFDGVGADNCHTWIETNVGANADAINPRTGEIYTHEDHRDDMILLVQAVQNKISPKIFLGNGVGYHNGCYGGGFWDVQTLTEPLVDSLDAIALEGFIRWGGEKWRTEANWILDIDAHEYLSQKGKMTMVMINLYDGLPAGATFDQVSLFGITSYLLGKNGVMDTYRLAGYDYVLPEIDFGVPLELYHMRTDSHVYEREYSKSLILVNPTNTDYTISLGRNYNTMAGQTVSTITVKAHTGKILTK